MAKCSSDFPWVRYQSKNTVIKVQQDLNRFPQDFNICIQFNYVLIKEGLLYVVCKWVRLDIMACKNPWIKVQQNSSIFPYDFNFSVNRMHQVQNLYQSLRRFHGS